MTKHYVPTPDSSIYYIYILYIHTMVLLTHVRVNYTRTVDYRAVFGLETALTLGYRGGVECRCSLLPVRWPHPPHPFHRGTEKTRFNKIATIIHFALHNR